MTLRAALRRSRREFVVALAVLGLAGAVAAHHGVPMDMHSMPAAALCLAIVTVAGAVVAVGAAVVFWRRIWAPVVRCGARSGWASARRGPPARAGPLFVWLQVLRR
jgi:peptidoglycan/LPS O-acetylase OafA/YrhL